MKRLVFISLSLVLTAGCGQVDSAIVGRLKPIVESFNRIDPDFIPGEIVITTQGTPGHEVKAVIGEVTEKVTTSNGHVIEAVFYQ
jgi:hypothetical protein